MRYPVSGTCTQQVPPNTSTGATGVCTLLSITSGRVFWLRGLTMIPSGTAGLVEIYDATAQTTATGQTIRMLLSAATALVQTTHVLYDFPPPGVKFANSYVIAKLAASGAIAIGGMNIWGYEE